MQEATKTYTIHYISSSRSVLLPVHNFVLMQVLQTQHNARSIEDTSWFCEHVVVYVHHKVTATSVLHYKTNVLLETKVVTYRII